jgi:multiple sugar transport system permease protein
MFREKADELRAAGLDPDRPPRTWSETLAYSKVLTEFNEDGTLKVAGFMPNFGNSWLYLYAFQMNASFMSADGRSCTLNSPETQKALQFMVDGYDLLGGYQNAERYQSTFLGEENDPFLVDQVAMMIHGDWMLKHFFRYKPDLDFGTAPPPAPDDRVNRVGDFADEDAPYITWAGGWSYAIPRGAKNYKEAWEFIKFISSFEGRKIDKLGQQKYEQSRGRRYIPGISGSIEMNAWAADRFASGDTPFDEAIRNHVAIMDHAKIRPTTFAAQVLWNEHVRAAEMAMRGDTSVEKALADGQSAVQRVIDEVNNREEFPVVNLMIPLYVGIGLALGSVFLTIFLIRRKKLGRIAMTETKWGYLFISPWIIGFLIFTLGPMAASLMFSFTQYNVLTDARWVGGQNYLLLFGDDLPLIMKSLWNVTFLAVVGIPLSLITGLAIAMLLNTDVKGMRIYRTLYYLPAIVPGVATVILWMWILNADLQRGLANALWSSTVFEWFGMTAPAWLVDPDWTKPSLIIIGLWGAGSGMILWLAGLKGVPGTLYEAAEIDGASPMQQFFKVTLPQLSPLIFFTSVMGFIAALQTFDQVYIITGGANAGPSDSLLMPVYHLFTNGFTYFRMGYASALAWLLFAVILIITLIQFKLAPKWVHYEVEK